MTNHVHLLATPEAATSLPRAMQSVGRVYVQYSLDDIVDLQGRSGTLWEGRYKATIVDSDRYLLACMRYIELNPVRAGLVEHPERYPWSSHRANAFGVSDPLVSRAFALSGAWDARRRPAERAISRCSADRFPTTRRARSATLRRTRGRWADAEFRRNVERLGRRAESEPIVGAGSMTSAPR